jgi:hypothetical protein
MILAAHEMGSFSQCHREKAWWLVGWSSHSRSSANVILIDVIQIRARKEKTKKMDLGKMHSPSAVHVILLSLSFGQQDPPKVGSPFGSEFSIA